MITEQEVSYRYANRISFSILLWMVCFAIITTVAGVFYAEFKNDRAAIYSEIENINRDIAASTMKTNEYRAKINSMTARWNMLGRLDMLGSDMREIQSNQLEELRTLGSSEAGKATAAR